MKMIYGVVAPRVKHPTLVEKVSVKLYSKSDMVHMMLELKYILPLLLNPKTYYLLYANTRRSYHRKTISNNVGCIGSSGENS